jgi:hypothetical protein
MFSGSEAVGCAEAAFPILTMERRHSLLVQTDLMESEAVSAEKPSFACMLLERHHSLKL